MRLYTICVRDLPAVVMSVDADGAIEDWVVADPLLLNAYRHTQEIEAKLPEHIRLYNYHCEIDEALDTWLGADLRALEHNARPLWTGKKRDLDIRAANLDEISRWHVSHREAINTGEIDAGEDSWLLFLVPMRDPTDEE